MSFITVAAIGAGVAGLSQIAGGIIGSGKRKREERDAREALEKRMVQFEALDTSNPYADVTNPYANLENTMEDLTVDQRQAQFMAQQGQQQRADIMQQMGGAAGASGIAGLAQAMANQGQLQTQRAAASIGQQERANQMAAAQQGARLQQMEAGGEMAVQQMQARGEIQSREWERDKISTLLGMAQQRKGAATAARQQATNQILGGIGTLGSAAMQIGMGGAEMQSNERIAALTAGSGGGGGGTALSIPTNTYGLQQPAGEIPSSTLTSPYGQDYNPYNQQQIPKAPWE